MKRTIALFAVCFVFVVATSVVADDTQKTTEEKVEDLTLNIPASWTKGEPSNNLRLAQFAVPAAAGDTEDAELTVFNFGAGGGVAANINRWKGQFTANENRNMEVAHGEAAQGDVKLKYVYVEIAGTFNKPVGPPIQGKTEEKPGYRALAAIIAVPEKGVYYLKMTGPDKTVAAQVAAFRASFGANKETEKALDIEE